MPLGLKMQQLDFLGSKFSVNFFAFIDFCSLLGSISTNFSNELKSLPDIKLFVSFVISLSDL